MNFNIKNQSINNLVSFFDYIGTVKTGYVSFMRKDKSFAPIIVKTDTREVESFDNLKAEDSKFLFWIGDTAIKKDLLPYANVDEETKNSIQKIFNGEINFLPLYYFKF